MINVPAIRKIIVEDKSLDFFCGVCVFECGRLFVGNCSIF